MMIRMNISCELGEFFHFFLVYCFFFLEQSRSPYHFPGIGFRGIFFFPFLVTHARVHVRAYNDFQK